MTSLCRLAAALLFLASTTAAEIITWPRQMTRDGAVLTTYQPQVQSWENYEKVEFRTAFSLKPKTGAEVVGVLYLTATTEVDMDNRTVLVRDVTVERTKFPSLEEGRADSMGTIARSFYDPKPTMTVSLDQVVACTPKKDSVQTVSVKNDPPVIFVSTGPTVLLQLEGKPVKASVGKEGLEFVVNASYPLFFDTTGTGFYLYDGLEWQKAPAADGPWKFTGSIPTSLTNLAKDTTWKVLKGSVPPATKANKKIPQVYYSEELAELILFEGEPSYRDINGTSLKFATNTTSDIFLCSADKRYYFLTAGRWFRSPGFNGPWTFATNDLPADFLKIPDDNPAASILAFVPGTEQAKDAVMIAQIPTRIEVNAAEAAKQVHITYTGDPVFQPIDSTKMEYAVNTTDKVIKVSTGQYYACINAVWFVSTTPSGPWTAAESIPAEIYAMPASSPVYNVTYVTQVVTTTNTVQATYTSGYMGVYVVGAPSGVIIVSGSGYYHPPYYYYPPYGYPVYYPYPVTYGMYAYHPYPYGGVSYHASYNPNTGMYSRSATAYGAYGTATVAQGYNPSTGTYARGASVSTPYGTRTAAQAYNPYTGTAASTRQGSSPNAQWGTTTVAKGGQTAQAAHISTPQGSAGAVKTGSGDMYATKDGNVYKNTGSGWEQAGNPSSQPGAPGQTKAAQGGTAAKTGTATQTGAAATGQAGAKQQPAGTGQTKTAGGSAPTQTRAAASGAARQAGPSAAAANELNREQQNRQRGNAQSRQFGGKSGSGGHPSAQPAGGRSGGKRR